MSNTNTYIQHLKELEAKHGKPAVEQAIKDLEDDLGTNGWDLFTSGELNLIDQYLPH